MQLIPRYLVKNRTTIVANEAGFIVEYRPVYTRQLKVYKGIDNVLEFRVLNADQKPVDISSYTPKFQAFDEDKKLIIERDGVAITDNTNTVIKGLFKVTITENDLLNVKDQFLSYNIHLAEAGVCDGTTNTLTYSNAYFDACATIEVSSCAFPAPKDNITVTTFIQVTEDTPYWISETACAEPGINGNEALHTAVIYATDYVGDVTVQTTLDHDVTESSSWSDITGLEFDGTETTPVPVNFNGVYTHLRFKASADPTDKISKILVRN